MEHIENSFEVLASRYNVGFAQQTADKVARLAKRDIQFLEIKELNDLAAEYRGRLRDLLASYRRARGNAQGDHVVRQVYVSYEAIFIRRQIADLWQVYRIVMADSHEMTADYLVQLRTRHNRQASLPTGKDNRAAA